MYVGDIGKNKYAIKSISKMHITGSVLLTANFIIQFSNMYGIVEKKSWKSCKNSSKKIKLNKPPSRPMWGPWPMAGDEKS
jgi:hypothetical protein